MNRSSARMGNEAAEMISFEQAKQIAIQHIGPECELVEECTVERSYGWYFAYETKQWLRTRQWRYRLIGSGGFIVEREDGRVYTFGSAFPLERNFAASEYGLRYNVYDLTVRRIFDFEKTVDLLMTLGLTYVIPETAYGRTWRIPQDYHRAELSTLLRNLPHTFAYCRGFYFRYENFLEIDRAGCCEYELTGHRNA